MYPQQELNQLAARKVVLQREIAFQRASCAEAATRLARPLEWLDHILVIWRRFSAFAPLAAVPLAFLFRRGVFRRRKILGTVLRWSPLVIRTMRGLGTLFKARSASSVS